MIAKKIASSPERHTFQKEGYIKRCKEKGKEPNPDYVKLYESWREQDEEDLKDPVWQKNNMEYDLRSSKEMCDKVKQSDNYAQNLYAAMCNQNFQKQDVWPVLKNETWSCSWRHAGGIVADMREEGDYIDWYCSGIGSQDTGYGLDGYKPQLEKDGRNYVPESHITEEIQKDLFNLGWVPMDIPDSE